MRPVDVHHEVQCGDEAAGQRIAAQRSAAPPISRADGAIRWLDQVTDGSDLQDLQFIERGDPAGWNTLTEVLHSDVVITRSGHRTRRGGLVGDERAQPFACLAQRVTVSGHEVPVPFRAAPVRVEVGTFPFRHSRRLASRTIATPVTDAMPSAAAGLGATRCYTSSACRWTSRGCCASGNVLVPLSGWPTGRPSSTPTICCCRISTSPRSGPSTATTPIPPSA